MLVTTTQDLLAPRFAQVKVRPVVVPGSFGDPVQRRGPEDRCATNAFGNGEFSNMLLVDVRRTARQRGCRNQSR